MKFLTKSAIAGAMAATIAFNVVPAYADDAKDTKTSESLETVINDMLLENDKPLAYNGEVARRFYGPGAVLMGNNARGDHSPKYFKDALVDKDYVDSDPWNAIVPWLEVFTHRDNKANNTSIEMSNIELHVLRKSTNKWQEVQSTAVEGMIFPKHGQSGEDTPATISDSEGNKKIVPANSENLMFHGWGSAVDPRELPSDAFSTDDIKAVFVTTKARLVKTDPNGKDDRDQSEYHLQMGGDYYPEKDVYTYSPKMLMYGPDGKPMVDAEGKPVGTWFPGIGMGRAKRVTNDWQSFNFITIDDGDLNKIEKDPGGGISIDELKKNPPSLD